MIFWCFLWLPIRFWWNEIGPNLKMYFLFIKRARERGTTPLLYIQISLTPPAIVKTCYYAQRPNKLIGLTRRGMNDVQFGVNNIKAILCNLTCWSLLDRYCSYLTKSYISHNPLLLSVLLHWEPQWIMGTITRWWPLSLCNRKYI